MITVVAKENRQLCYYLEKLILSWFTELIYCDHVNVLSYYRVTKLFFLSGLSVFQTYLPQESYAWALMFVCFLNLLTSQVCITLSDRLIITLKSPAVVIRSAKLGLYN